MPTLKTLRNAALPSDFTGHWGGDSVGIGTATRYSRYDDEGNKLVFRGEFRYDADGELTRGFSDSALYYVHGNRDPVAQLSDVVFTTDALKNGIPDEFDEMLYLGSGGGDNFLGTGLRPDTLSGDETLRGLGGDDAMYIGDYENAVAEGGSGEDLIFLYNVQGLTAGIYRVDLNLTGAQALPGGRTVTLSSVERVWGTLRTDALVGDNGANFFYGDEDNDTLVGDRGDDTLNGGPQDDKLYGGSGDDSLRGYFDDDTLDGGLGDDTLDGEAGVDLADYSAFRRVKLDLSITGPQDVGRAGIETVVNIENVRGGITGDVITGNNAANAFEGAAGNDRLTGGLGNDTLSGGTGDDILVGGGGTDVLVGGGDNDTFRWGSAADANGDTISDFDLAGNDVIDLSGIDAHPGGADDAFAFVGGFSGAGGELVVVRPPTGPGNPPGPSFVTGDVDGDKSADFTIVLSTTFVVPTQADFIL